MRNTFDHHLCMDINGVHSSSMYTCLHMINSLCVFMLPKRLNITLILSIYLAYFVERDEVHYVNFDTVILKEAIINVCSQITESDREKFPLISYNSILPMKLNNLQMPDKRNKNL